MAVILWLTVGTAATLGQTTDMFGKDLVGVWEATKEVDCTTGEPVVPFLNVTQTFHYGGTTYVEDTLSIDRYRTTGSGVWKRTGAHTYSYGFFHYGFDSTGLFTYTVKGRSNLRLSRDANSYTERGSYDIALPDGTVIMSACFAGSSRRMAF